MADFTRRLLENVPGKYYIDWECTDCDGCRAVAPEHFHRNDENGYCFVAKQPETEKEIALCEEAFEACPCEVIGNDGDQHNWSIPPNLEWPSSTPSEIAKSIMKSDKPPCPKCKKKKKRWWEFWKI